jgi:CRP-like cAMP-binding protein
LHAPAEGGNELILALPAVSAVRLHPCLQLVTLERQEVLFRAPEIPAVVYFPVSSVIGLVATVESGQTLAVGLVGRDGVVGAPIAPGLPVVCDAVVHCAGSAYRIGADLLRDRLAQEPALATAIDRYNQVLLARGMQIAACNLFHAVEQRCVRWLLTVNDLIGRDEIPLTHEVLSSMLGVHRPTLTHVLGVLHRARLIEERRGRVLIRDRRRLEAVSCECYERMRDVGRRLT